VPPAKKYLETLGKLTSLILYSDGVRGNIFFAYNKVVPIDINIQRSDFKLPSSVKYALAILLVVMLYFGVRTFTAPDNTDGAQILDEQEYFPVVAEIISPAQWQDTVTVRGRTEAERKVIVRAETPGAVASTPASLGSLVKQGDILCRQKVDARRASLTEAKASLAKAKLDYDAAQKLTDEGFRSAASLAGLKAAFDLSRANLQQAEINLAKTNIAAPFDGVFEERMAEKGDFLGVGDPCGVVIQRSPFLITGSISEKDVAKISEGDNGVARLSTGEEIQGHVKFIGRSADPATRTFRVELEVPNEDGNLRDGLTAEFSIFAKNRNAHLIPRSSLTLNDEGIVGVRAVGNNDIVHFNRVDLIGESLEGVWVAGLDGNVNIITRGQDFVSEGQRVEIKTPERNL